MKIKLCFLLAIIISQAGYGQANRTIIDSVRYLAMGDSYTVGRFVPTAKSFPYQLAASLKNKGINVALPIVLAQNGWRTDELLKGIAGYPRTGTFDFVTLLIGVNNQYQNKNPDIYKTEFTQILNAAIIMAKGNPKHVFVLSIPDWGSTPFANGRNLDKISAEIDEYNFINKVVADAAKVHYINITGLSRTDSINTDLVTTDHLHPSARMYSWWVQKIAKVVAKEFKK
ncbi:SGNH/GDSL hydrolase family protein [Mucilaginibacter lutimaris]|uniref:SGNH/GDSL hydrolase family protein n=1 Tax=Mucilaginibacter lutimaris TaxID=931629 RepID=A0ABW2ZHT3_9SPHI